MKLDRFLSLHPSDRAELFTALVLYVPVPQTSDIAEKLFFWQLHNKDLEEETA